MDLFIQNHGTLHLIEARSSNGQDWVDQNVEVPDHMVVGTNTVACESNFIETIVAGASADGLDITIV